MTLLLQACRSFIVLIAMLLATATAGAKEVTIALAEGHGSATFSEESLVFSKCEALEVGYSFDIPLEVMTQSKMNAGVVMQRYTATLDNGDVVDGLLTGEIDVVASQTYRYKVTGNEMTRQPVRVSMTRGNSGGPTVEIATWAGFRKGAVSFTFDDGAPSHVSDAGPLFDKYGYKATFNLVVNWNPDWSGFGNLAKNGHEIASHSNTHGNNMSGEEASSKKAIEGKIQQKYGVITVAYPNCNVPNESAVLQNYIVGRICNSGNSIVGKDGPSNWARVPAIMTGPNGSNDFKGPMGYVVNSNSWVSFLTHGFSGKNNGNATYSPTDISLIEDALKYAQQNDKDIWVAPMGHVAMYIKERKASKVEVKASNDYSTTIQLKHTIADNVSKYDYPLSLRVKSDWNKVEVTQDGAELENKIDGGYIYFDAVPNAGDIVVRNTGVKYVTVTPGTNVTVSGTVAWTSDGTDYYAEGATITLGYDGTVPTTGYTVGYTVTKAGGGTVSVDVTDGISSFVTPADDVTVSVRLMKQLTITAASGTKVYDGTALTGSYTSEGLLEGDAIVSVTVTGSQTAVGTCDNVASAAVIKNGDVDVTANYIITYVKGTLAVTTKTVSSPTITLSETSYVYDGTAKQPTVTVKDGETVIPETEYTVGYSDNTAAGTATVTITDKEGGNYSVSGSATFVITAKTVSTPSVTLSETSFVYDGSAKEPAVTVKDGETVIPETEYTVVYSDNTAAGIATVTITDKEGGNYSVSGSATFVITAKTVSTPSVTLSETSFVYDGSAKEPTVTVKDGETVIPETEYTVGYSDNTAAGTATVTITDKEGGNYSVSGSATFVIFVKGDANNDKKVDVADLVEMVNARDGHPSVRFVLKAADIDGSGSITDSDITAVANLIMKGQSNPM